jgi:hypothetical protein
VFAFGLKKGIKHLVMPTFLSKQLVIYQAHFGWILASDVGGAKNEIPDKQQVAKVAFVMTNAVFVGDVPSALRVLKWCALTPT